MRPTREQLLMGMAHLVARRSTCDRLMVGALIAYQHRVISMGYNGVQAGEDHCREFGCDTSKPCTRPVVHAEENAIYFAKKIVLGFPVHTDLLLRAAVIPFLDTELYTTHSPCLRCSRIIIREGIRKVYFGEEFRDLEGLRELLNNGVMVQKVQYGSPEVIKLLQTNR